MARSGPPLVYEIKDILDNGVCYDFLLPPHQYSHFGHLFSFPAEFGHLVYALLLYHGRVHIEADGVCLPPDPFHFIDVHVFENLPGKKANENEMKNNPFASPQSYIWTVTRELKKFN